MSPPCHREHQRGRGGQWGRSDRGDHLCQERRQHLWDRGHPAWGEKAQRVTCGYGPERPTALCPIRTHKDHNPPHPLGSGKSHAGTHWDAPPGGERLWEGRGLQAEGEWGALGEGGGGTRTLSPLAPGRPAAPRSPGIPCNPGGPWFPGAPGAPASPWGRNTAMEVSEKSAPSLQERAAFGATPTSFHPPKSRTPPYPP